MPTTVIQVPPPGFSDLATALVYVALGWCLSALFVALEAGLDPRKLTRTFLHSYVPIVPPILVRII